MLVLGGCRRLAGRRIEGVRGVELLGDSFRTKMKGFFRLSVWVALGRPGPRHQKRPLSDVARRVVDDDVLQHAGPIPGIVDRYRLVLIFFLLLAQIRNQAPPPPGGDF